MTKSVRKTFRMSVEHLKKIQCIKEENNLQNFTSSMAFIIENFESEHCKNALNLEKKIDRALSKFIPRFLSKVENNLTIPDPIYDHFNTLELINTKVDLINKNQNKLKNFTLMNFFECLKPLLIILQYEITNNPKAFDKIILNVTDILGVKFRNAVQTSEKESFDSVIKIILEHIYDMKKESSS